jgi:lipopolysaccharide assembly outer membrane protein LptD (OstA)
MKLVAMAMCLACLPAVGQDTLRGQDTMQGQNTMQGKMGPPGLMLRRAETLSQISKSIEQHQSFQLPENSLGSNVAATATGVVRNGDTLKLTGVEITTGNIVVTADEVIYYWDTRQIEARGSVRIKSATQR